VDDAGSRVAATPLLYRVLTTMSRPAFAVIRAHTHGRSAVQSRAFRQVERISAVLPPRPEDDMAAKVTVAGPTLQEVFATRMETMGAGRMRRVAEAMMRLDEGWRAMKRTHWGITRKIIGDVPGTGGTSGAAYLRNAAELPLFPLLHELGWSRPRTRKVA
jgi:tryptophan 2,3-dioxygenase